MHPRRVGDRRRCERCQGALRSPPVPSFAPASRSRGHGAAAWAARPRGAAAAGSGRSVPRLQNDPLADMVEALSQPLAVQFELHVSCAHEYRNAAAHLEQQLRASIVEARQPVDPAALAELKQAAATDVDCRAADLARSHNWRTLAISGAVLAGAVLLALGGGFAWGRQTANAAIAETDRRLVAVAEAYIAHR